MSINHFSSDHQDTQWWSNTSNPTQDPSQQHHHNAPHFIPQFYQDAHPHNYQAWPNSQQQLQQPTATNANLSFNLNHNDPEFDHGADQLQLQHHLQKSQDGDDDGDEEKEPMFEKPLTPSDVGKLNRLVIPKQHAEKYFPLGGGDSGLLLSFEDESGKSWRFRYSYWNSSQSYVLTKGWSRYVKEKRLDAGDVVLFERQRAHTDRLFIGWRRRSAAATPAAHDSGVGAAAQVSGGGNGESSSSNNNGAAGGWTRMFYSAPHHHHNNNSSSYPAHQYAPYPPDYLHAAGSGAVQNNMNQTTSSSVGSSSKILRLFGVNLECHQQQRQQQQEEEAEPHHHESEPSTPDGSSSLSMSSSQGPTPTHHQQLFTRAYNYGEQRDFTFTRDVNPMRNRRG